MRYGVVKDTFWTDPKVEGLSLHAKAVFLHFLTCPELTIVGLVNVSPGIMGYRLRLDTPSVLLAIKELEDIGAVKSDYDNQVFWIVNFIKHNRPLGPKQKTGCISCLKLYDFTPLSKDLSKTYRSSIQEVCKPQEQVQVQEQEQIQEQEQETTPSGAQLFRIPLKVGEHIIYQAEADKWKALYPRLDVMYELREIAAWNMSNPAKRKTRGGISRHINGWLSKAHRAMPKQTEYRNVTDMMREEQELLGGGR